jgi:chromosome segregation ATPase
MSKNSNYALTALDERIASALSSPTSSKHVLRLVVESRAALETATSTADASRKEALNPTLSAQQIACARDSAQESSFRRDRLAVAVATLEERLAEVSKAEENERRQVAYDDAKKQRDDLAAELKDTYPELSAKLADLASRIESNNRRLDTINRQLPDAERKLASAEAIARDIRSFDQGSISVPRITKALRLPSFEFNQRSRYVWPINSGSMLD